VTCATEIERKVDYMKEKVISSLIGLACALLGILAGWYLNEVARRRKERTEAYRAALGGVRDILEKVIGSTGSQNNLMCSVGRETISQYRLALERLAPYEDRLGRGYLAYLEDVIGGEISDCWPTFDAALKCVNEALAKAH